MERKSIKRVLLSLSTLVLLALTLVGIAQAASIEVTCTPETIILGGSTTITVTCDRDATGSITVIAPDGGESSVDIIISAGGSTSAVYPEQFPSPATTSEIGEYEVVVTLSGEKFKVNFWVTFEVYHVPDFPLLGTAGAAVAMLSGLGFHVIKRRRLK